MVRCAYEIVDTQIAIERRTKSYYTPAMHIDVHRNFVRIITNLSWLTIAFNDYWPRAGRLEEHGYD